MATFLLAVATPGSAAASSLVFIREGNVWLTSPDGATQYAITDSGDYAQPSQADDGTIAAVQAPGAFVRLDRTGEPIVPPFLAIGSAAESPLFEGPFASRISPDAAHIGYSFVAHLEVYDPGCDCTVIDTRDVVMASRSDAFTDPNTTGFLGRWGAPSWVGNDRLLVSDGVNVGTWAIGGDHSWFQRWFDDRQLMAAISALELARDGSRLVVAHGDEGGPPTRINLYLTNGPPFTPDGPPYDPFDPTRPRPTPPTARCMWERDSAVSGLTWAPDGSAFAFADGAGVWRVPLPPTFADCGELSGGEMVAPAGTQPHWGAADVEPPPGPRPGGGGGGGGGGGMPTAPGPVTLAACVGTTTGLDRTRCVCGLGLAVSACHGSRVPPAVRRAFAAGCAFANRTYGPHAARMRRRSIAAFVKGRRALARAKVGRSFTLECRRGIAASFGAARP
jgi:hypothetical protein